MAGHGEPDLFGIADALCVASEAALVAGDVDEDENLAASAVAMTSPTLPNLLTVRSAVALSAVDVVLRRRGGTAAVSRRRDLNLL